MPHNLETHSGNTSMFYTGDVPWHHLGQHLDHPANASEAMEAANLDYTVVKKPLKAVITIGTIPISRTYSQMFGLRRRSYGKKKSL